MPHNAPVAMGDSHIRTKGFGPDLAKDRAARNAQEAREHALTQMPVGTFTNKFLQETEEYARAQQMMSSRGAFAKFPKLAPSTEDVHGFLLEALQNSTKRKSRCPGYSFADMPFHPVFPEVSARKRHIACYASHNLPFVSTPDLTPAVALGYAELIFDVDPDSTHDCFAKPPATGARENGSCLSSEEMEEEKRSDLTLGYHVELVTELLARQHRLFVFTVSVFGSRARILRWDRAGCIATEPFNIRSNPELLCNFLGRYSRASAAARGLDPTVEAADEEEERLFKEAITRRVQYELDIAGDALELAVKEHYAPGRVFAMRIAVKDSHSNETSVFRLILSRPVISPTGLTGRCTRGFWAFDPSTGEVVFVKDTWRSGSGDTEGEVISRLLAAGVRNVPELVCHGDVWSCNRVQKTKTDHYQEFPWAVRCDGSNHPLPCYVHYRLVLATVGYGLKQFKGSEELLYATYDAFQAMQDAYSKDRRIHRDISLGNVILVRDRTRTVRRGYLIDWEVSSQVDANDLSLDHHRTGTWRFMSCKMLMLKGAVHTLEEDMESLLWVILYCALLWLPHDLPTAKLQDTVRALFEQYSSGIDFATGGFAKLANVIFRQYTGGLTFHTPVHKWLATAFHFRNPVGVEVLSEDMKKRWSEPQVLDIFWSKFLKTTGLPANDRCEHLARPSRDESGDLTTAYTTSSIWPTVSSKSSKRKAEPACVEADESEPKRRKAAPPPVPGSKPPASVQARVPNAPLRRRAQASCTTQHRYSLRLSTEVVSKYRRPHTT